MEITEEPPAAVTFARLMESPGHVVYEEVERLGRRDALRQVFFVDPETERLEHALLGRAEPLIDIALATYGRSSKVVAALCRRQDASPHSSEVERAIRLGCLSNSIGGAQSFFASPGGLNADELAQIVVTGDEEEVHAVLSNSAAGDVIQKLFALDAPFDSIPDERKVRAVQFCVGNPALNRDKSDDSGPDLLAFGIHKAAFRLVLNAPVSEQWLRALHRLLLGFNPARTHTPTAEEAAEALSRWGALRIERSFGEQGEEMGYHTTLSLVDEFRCLVGSIYGRSLGKAGFISVGVAESDDVALRCAHYANLSGKALTLEAMDEGRKRDEWNFTFAALWNDGLLLRPQLRAELETQLTDDLQRLYLVRCKQVHERWPGFDPNPVSEAVQAPNVPTATLESVAGAIARFDSQLTAVRAKVETLSSFPSWPVWISIALLAYIAWRH